MKSYIGPHNNLPGVYDSAWHRAQDKIHIICGINEKLSPNLFALIVSPKYFSAAVSFYQILNRECQTSPHPRASKFHSYREHFSHCMPQNENRQERHSLGEARGAASVGGQGVGTTPFHSLGSWFPFLISSFLRQKLGCFPLHSFSPLLPSDQHNHNQAVAGHVDKGCFLPSWSVKGTMANTSPGIVFSSLSSHYVNCFIQPHLYPIYHSSYNRTGILRPCLAALRELIFCRN